MTIITESKFAMLRGLIALVWADNKLVAEERIRIETYINYHLHLLPEQRAQLLAELESGLAMKDIWPSITDAQDRAELLDLASALFHADGARCDAEKALYEELLSLHLKTLDVTHIEAEIKQMAETAKKNRAREEQEYLEAIKQDEIPGMRYVELLLYRLDKIL